MRRLAVLGALGIPAQAGLGGITVLTGLNPWTVGLHLLLSMALIAVAVVLHQRSREGDAPPRWLVAPPLKALAGGLLVLVGATLAVGTVVTGSGPHSGDPAAGRNGLDPQALSQLHADLVFLLVGLTAAFWLALRATGGPSRPMGVLLAVLLGQGVVGFVQYYTDLPVLLVGLHLVGACVIQAYAVYAVLALRTRGPGPGPTPTPPTPVIHRRIPVVSGSAGSCRRRCCGGSPGVCGGQRVRSWAATASAKRAAAPGACARNRHGSVSSSSISSGAPSGPGTRSTRT